MRTVCPVRVVMETLGHSQIALTMDTYPHVLPLSSGTQRTRWRPSSRMGEPRMSVPVVVNVVVDTREPPRHGLERLTRRFRAQRAGEPRRTRTFNRLIKSQLLYH